MPSHKSNSSVAIAVNTRRTQRVLLRLAILVRAGLENKTPVTEDTYTLNVNAHGALIALDMDVHPGQTLFLRNWATAEEQEFRVIHVRKCVAGKNEVGIAFVSPRPKFWNIAFPPPDWTAFTE